MVLRPVHLKAILCLTLGWMGVEMSGALDSVQFQLLLSQYVKDAKTIGLILCLGPMFGMLQPFMGSFADSLRNKGMSRRKLLMLSALMLALSIIGVGFTWNLPSLVAAIAFFYFGLNLVIINYRALVGEVGNRQALSYFKGTITGFMGLFSGVGGLTMYLLNSLSNNSSTPVIGAILVLLAAFTLLFIFVPRVKTTKNPPSFLESDPGQAERQHLVTPLSLAFYAMPFLALFPQVEAKIAPQAFKKAIFRLLMVTFMLWFGIGAMRYFFFLFATKQLHIPASQASLPLCAFTLSMLLVSVPLGKIADKIDNRILLRYTTGLYLFGAAFGYFFVHDLTTCMILMTLMGIGFAGNASMPLTILFRLCPPKSEGTYLGLYNMFLCIPQLYSLLLTGCLVDMQGDYRVIMVVAGLAMFSAFALTFRILPTSYHVVVPFKTPAEKAMEA